MNILTVLLAAGCSLYSTKVDASVFEVSEGGEVVRIDSNSEMYANKSATKMRKMITPAKLPPATRFRPVVAVAAHQYQLSPSLVNAIAKAESNFNQRAVSRAGAIGTMQLMPQTAKELGVNPHDANDNIRGGTAYLRMLLNKFDGDIVRTIAAYNAGPNAVVRAGGVPPYPETIAYVNRVLDHLAAAAQ